MIKRILVTGSNGTIGTRLTEKLLERGYDVIGVDRKTRAWRPEVGERTLNFDLTDGRRMFDELPEDIDMIIHLAANARVHNLVVDPSLAHENLTTTFNVLEFARRRGIRRFMFSSSRETYGNRNEFVNREEHVDIRCCPSPYTAAKIADEAMIWAYQRCYGIDFVTFRFSNVYGMYDDSDRLVQLYLRRASEGKDLIVYGKDKLLDFTYIDDTVAGVLLGIEKFDQVKNDVYNLACGEGTAIMTVAEMIKEATGSSSNIVVHDNRPGEVVRHIADIQKAKATFGYEPRIPFPEGLRRTIAWYRAHPEALVRVGESELAKV
jgi:nucleoside-diphosphate-sugar epimerase